MLNKLIYIYLVFNDLNVNFSNIPINHYYYIYYNVCLFAGNVLRLYFVFFGVKDVFYHF